MTGTVIFDPLLPWAVLWALAVVVAVFVGVALWRGLSGWALRGLSVAVLLTALSSPSLQQEDRQPLSDIVIAVVDDSASQKTTDRPDQTVAALANLQTEVAAQPNTELRVVHVGDAKGDGGTQLMTALSEALAAEPRARIAGAILITDGQAHDLPLAPQMPAPLHVLLTGKKADWDRRLVIRNAPAFAILGEPVTLTVRIEDQGNVPAEAGVEADLSISVVSRWPSGVR